MSTVNLYDVLNVSNDCPTKEIKASYRKLAKEFHPDRQGGDEEMFELVTHAYNILNNPSSRKEYDELFNLLNQSETSHFDLKNQSINYNKSQESDITKKNKSKKELENDFKKNYEGLDRKHGLTREKELIDKISEKDITRKLRDLQLAREQDDIENIQEKIFDDKVTLSVFNSAFDSLYKTHNEMTKHNGNPDAWNSINLEDARFSSIDNYENIYAEDENNNSLLYGSVKSDQDKKKKISKEEIEKLPSVEYTSGHNVKDKDYNKFLEDRIKEISNETFKYNDMTMEDFENDLSCGGYGIFAKLGIKNINSISCDDDNDLKTRYKKLLEVRKNDTNLL